MGIFSGANPVNDIKVGSTDVQEVYVGSNLVWQRADTVMTVGFGGGESRYGFSTLTPSYGSLTNTTGPGGTTIAYLSIFDNGTSTRLGYKASSHDPGTGVFRFTDGTTTYDIGGSWSLEATFYYAPQNTAFNTWLQGKNGSDVNVIYLSGW